MAEEAPTSGLSRQRLLDAALRLFDERGIDATSARAVAVAAGHGNVAAVSYHFGSLDGLLREVLLSHQQRVDARRQELFDELDARSEQVTARDALDATYRPLIEQLDHAVGRRYVRVLNQAFNHPTWYADADPGWAPGIWRGVRYLLPVFTNVPDEVRLHRAQHALGFTLFAVAEQARLIDTDPPPRPPMDRQLFRADLVTVIERIIAS